MMSQMPSGAFSSQQGSFAPQKEKIPSGYKKFNVQNFSPEQMQLFQSLFQHLGPEGFLQKLIGGDEEMMQQIEEPALRQFAELQGGLASRFSGMGDLGARNSSGFKNEQSSAASNFAQELQSNRTNLMRSALQDLMSGSNALLGQRPYETGLVQKPAPQPSGWGAALGSLGGAGAGFALGGPAGALAGGKLGYKALGGF